MSSQTPAATDSRPIVILGASYAAGWKLPTVGSIPVRNVGVNGQQSFELLTRFDTDVAAARPRAVLIWGFINDLFRNSDPAAALARMRESYLELVKRARASGVEPVLATEITIRPPKGFPSAVKSFIAPLLGKTSYQEQINASVLEGNRWIREFARREGLLLLDLQQALADSDGTGRRYAFATDDGSHISPDGYEALTAYARPLLLGRLNSGTTRGPAER